MSAVRARLLPWLLALPALLFALPFSPLAEDPYPHLAGAGLGVVLLLPLAALILVGPAGAPRAWPFLLVLLWALVSCAAAPVTDGLEARRALCVLAILPATFTGGALLDARGRRVFAALLVALSCLWTGWALGRGFAGDSFAGVLGDTGSLSQAALPGAAIAGSWLATREGWKRVAGGLALVLFLGHVAAAPVLAGSHTLLAALLLGLWRGGSRGRPALLGLALAALLAPFAGMAARTALGQGQPSIEGASSEPSHSLGGLGVRARVWTAALGLVAEHPLVGTGPGQFQAAFPPQRDPREIELSRHGVCSELDTEVEHAHNDWLQGFCELGLVGGGLFFLALALAARDGLRALGDDERAPLAMAALALLVNAFVHAPLSSNPATVVLAPALFGALTAPRSGRIPAVLAGLPILIAAPFGPAMITHGAALTDYVRSARRIDELARDRELSPEERQRVNVDLVNELARARATVLVAVTAVPSSAPAQELAARLASGTERLAAWERVLRVRPNSVGAWERSAEEYEHEGRFEEARERYRRALELSPTHPRLLRQVARLECVHGELERGLEALERLRAQGCLDPQLTVSLGDELVLALGRPERGARVLFGAPLASLSAEELHARSRGTAEEARVGAEECLAQLLWAREHAAAGEFELALRNYRQAAKCSHARRGSESGPAPLYALELAAAEARAGRREEAAPHLQGIEPDLASWEDLPGWARDALAGLGLARPE